MIKDIPILKLENSCIKSIFLDADLPCLLAGTSDGKILKIDNISSNIYGSGKRNIATTVKDGFGNQSDVFNQAITYALSNQLIRAEKDSVPEIVASKVDAYSAFQTDAITGTFISPALWAGNDFGYWENFIFSQNCPAGCETEFLIRTGVDTNSLYRNDWLSLYRGSESSQNIQMGATGNYLQIKISMTTVQRNQVPLIYRALVSYRTKHAVYFFTNNFVLEKNTNTKYGMFTATYSLKDSTEIEFGISDKNSANWEDYMPLEVNKIAAIPSAIQNRFKIGVKLISHALTAVAEIDDFVFFFDGEKKNMLFEGN